MSERLPLEASDDESKTETASILIAPAYGGEPVRVEITGEQVDEILPIVNQGSSN